MWCSLFWIIGGAPVRSIRDVQKYQNVVQFRAAGDGG
jgi:hypothetical protein